MRLTVRLTVKLQLGLLVILACLPFQAVAGQECVQIYYDKGPTSQNYNFGETYAVYLRNLIAHFPHIKQIIKPIESYSKGEIENCKSSIYLGSYFENQIPQEFLEDFAKTKKRVAWFGYSIWKYSNDQLRELFDSQYKRLTLLDSEKLDENGHPSFFRSFHYKGEVFKKFGQWVERDGERQFASAFELVELEVAPTARVLSWAEHSQSRRKIPYVINKGNRYYVADIPFSYIHESDRYLIVCDLLFDILNEKPRWDENLALIRIEDVHPLTPVSTLKAVAEVFRDEEVPLHIALVPIFYDPLYRFDREEDQEWLPLTYHQEFKGWIKENQSRDTVYIWHGVTHQYQKVANPHTGYSSDDFEFWDANNNRPVEDDSVDFVLDRLQLGSYFLEELDIYPKVWLTPHYQASALDYRIFSKVFEWNVGRVIYFLDEVAGERPDCHPCTGINFSDQNSSRHEAQRKHFTDLEVQTRGNWFGQLYPYEIYGDKYGQRLIPEILGNPQPYKSDHVVWPRSVDEILADARRNRVIRDSWASLFFHPYLLNTYIDDGIGDFPGDTSELRRLIQGLKSLGYRFINLDKFAERQRTIKNAQVEEIKE